jgi:hypothetical protein
MNPQPAQSETDTNVPPASDPPGGDHDQPYTWGRPTTTYLNYRQIVRLTILRSKIEAVRTERVGLPSRA